MTLDCLIVGGGPAGLTAAIYAARFRLSVQVIDAGTGRAALIPCTRNHAGFPDGISGRALLARMRRQALEWGAKIEYGLVSRLTTDPKGFAFKTNAGVGHARTILLATGVTNRRPNMPAELHAAAVTTGQIRYCPVCDGYDVLDQDVAVIGTAEAGVKEALFLCSYTKTVSLIAPDGKHTLTSDQNAGLTQAGVVIVDGPVSDFQLDLTGLSFQCARRRRGYAAIYPAMGSQVHSELARALGAELSDGGCVSVDAHQRTSISGLYAAGDVVIGLDQISHAMGQAGVAATTIRNDLAVDRPILR